MPDRAFTPTPEQIRAARAWLRLTQDQFADAAGIGKRTLARLELADNLPYDDTLEKVRDALIGLGVELLFENGAAAGIRVMARRESEALGGRRSGGKIRGDEE